MLQNYHISIKTHEKCSQIGIHGSKLYLGRGVFQMDLTESAPTPSGLGRPIESDDARTVGKYSPRTRAAIIVIGSLLSWGVIFLFVWSIFWR